MTTKKAGNGFSLIEIMLVLAILMGVTTLEMRRELDESRKAAAVATARKMKAVGEAVEQYQAVAMGDLQRGVDPNCAMGANNVCTLNLSALVSLGLLPASFDPITEIGGSVVAQIKRTPPPAPNAAACAQSTQKNPIIGCPKPGSTLPPEWQWNLRTIVFTQNAWTLNGVAATAVPEWSLLGMAARELGAGGAVVKAGGVMEGYKGNWSSSGADFPEASTTPGRLVLTTGSQFAIWSKYVRRDGSLPMQGNLDLGSNSINNMKDMFLNGTATTPINKNLTSMSPNWVFKGVYSASEGSVIQKPVCAEGGIPLIKLMMTAMSNEASAGRNGGTNGSYNCSSPASCATIVYPGAPPAQKAMQSWADSGPTSWTAHFRTVYTTWDASGWQTMAPGSGLAEVYCQYIDQ